jgi:hypothetical protein
MSVIPQSSRASTGLRPLSPLFEKWQDDIRSVAVSVNDYMYPDTGFLNRR